MSRNLKWLLVFVATAIAMFLPIVLSVDKAQKERASVVPVAQAQEQPVQHRIVIVDLRDGIDNSYPTVVFRDTQTGCEFIDAVTYGHLAYIPGTCKRSANVIEK